MLVLELVLGVDCDRRVIDMHISKHEFSGLTPR